MPEEKKSREAFNQLYLVNIKAEQPKHQITFDVFLLLYLFIVLTL